MIKALIISMGGTSTEVHYMLGLLNDMHNVEVTIAIPNSTDSSYIAEIERCFNVTKVIKLNVPDNLLTFFIKLFNPLFHYYLCKTINYKYDLTHFVFEWRLPITWVYYLLKRGPVILTVHEPRATFNTSSRKIFWNKLQELNCMLVSKMSDKVIVHGNKHKDFLISKGVNKEKINIIPHGQFSFLRDQNVGNSDTTNNNILFFGKIKSYKGIPYFIQAVKLLHNKFPSMKVTIAGSGDFDQYRPLIKGYDCFQIENRFIPDSEVGDFFSRASMVVMPYTDGSQSGIISIAASYKKPVIATKVGHFNEMILHEKTGLLVPPKNPEALAQAIEKLLVNEEIRVQMGQNAYDFMNTNFSWQNIAEKYYLAYKKLINESSHPLT